MFLDLSYILYLINGFILQIEQVKYQQILVQITKMNAYFENHCLRVWPIVPVPLRYNLQSAHSCRLQKSASFIHIHFFFFNTKSENLGWRTDECAALTFLPIPLHSAGVWPWKLPVCLTPQCVSLIAGPQSVANSCTRTRPVQLARPAQRLTLEALVDQAGKSCQCHWVREHFVFITRLYLNTVIFVLEWFPSEMTAATGPQNLLLL